MNILLWVLQSVLALFCLAGGSYKVIHFDQIANQMAPLGRGATGAVGMLEVLCGCLLIVPAAFKWMPGLTPLAAAILALDFLGFSILNALHSLALTPTNPLVWTAPLAVLAAFIAYGRYALEPVR